MRGQATVHRLRRRPPAPQAPQRDRLHDLLLVAANPDGHFLHELPERLGLDWNTLAAFKAVASRLPSNDRPTFAKAVDQRLDPAQRRPYRLDEKQARVRRLSALEGLFRRADLLPDAPDIAEALGAAARLRSGEIFTGNPQMNQVRSSLRKRLIRFGSEPEEEKSRCLIGALQAALGGRIGDMIEWLARLALLDGVDCAADYVAELWNDYPEELR